MPTRPVAPPGLSPPRRRTTLIACVAVALAAVGGCGGDNKQARKVDPIVRDVPTILRGTIGSECTIRGIEPVLVSGYGVVVGLNGTGGGMLPGTIQATMERELARGGIGKGALDEGPLAGKTPRQVLRDPNVAVVLVEGVIPPGAPKGKAFDVRVRALPNSGVTSLEGGRLWTTELRIGPATPFGAMRTQRIGEAIGPVFINPFADPNQAAVALNFPETMPAPGAPEAAPEPGGTPAPSAAEAPQAPAADAPAPAPAPTPTPGDGITRTVGRILGGGVVTQPLRLELVLDNPSHARAMAIKQAINSRFPAGPGDEGDIATGRSDSSIAVRVPTLYRDKPAEFVQLLRFLQIEQGYPQEFAKRYSEELTRQPTLADELSWCLTALGDAAKPFAAGLYDAPDMLVRFAALRAGAKLGDPRAAPALIAAAASPNSPPGFRAEVIALLGSLPQDPRVNLALRRLVDAPELQVRAAAYEALRDRNDAAVEQYDVGGKFFLDVVRSNDELIYVTQQGTPRVVLFGSAMRLAPPLLVSTWNDRLMLTADEDGPDGPGASKPMSVGAGRAPLTGPVRVYYRDYRSGQIIQAKAPGSVRDLVRFMAHKPGPEDPSPGLNLSYSEVVGALFAIQRQRGVGAAFATEQERLLAGLADASEQMTAEERPENEAARPKTVGTGGPAAVMAPLKPKGKANQAPTMEPAKGSMVVPLSPKNPRKVKDSE